MSSGSAKQQCCQKLALPENTLQCEGVTESSSTDQLVKHMSDAQFQGQYELPEGDVRLTENQSLFLPLDRNSYLTVSRDRAAPGSTLS